MLIQLLRNAKQKFAPSRDYTICSGSILPSPDRRYCGPEFRDNFFYLQSAESEATRLRVKFGCNSNTRVLDVGCGQGRLPIGILRIIGTLNYTGIDVDRKSIEWCKRHITKRHPSFRFHYLNVANERYNQSGLSLDSNFAFEFPSKSFDIIYLFSVFSHMEEKDMRIYLSEFARILDDDGWIFFTTFVEKDVPSMSINASDYVFKECSGPLHVVRYDQHHLFSILNDVGFMVAEFGHRTEVNGQSAVYLRKKSCT